jgi:methylmalonyl-CoA/ethylmalonyl-CoA epimerase
MADAPAVSSFAVLDHVAVALPRWQDGWPRYVGQLGGRWSSGAEAPGFAPSQLRFANDARLELLAPHQPEANPFLATFLARSGPGIHHVTFKVADLDEALRRAQAAGLQPVDVNRSQPDWQEAFLRPSQAQGIVVQLAQASGSWSSPPPPGFPAPAEPPAAFLGLVHAVADLGAARRLFQDLLEGSPVAELHGPGWQALELAWAGPLRLRLVAADPTGAPSADAAEAAVAAWLGGRPGRAHHLRFALPPDPPAGALPDARRHPVLGEPSGPAGVPWVPPEANVGAGLALVEHLAESSQVG